MRSQTGSARQCANLHHWADGGSPGRSRDAARARALQQPRPFAADPDKPSKSETAAIESWEQDNVFLYHKMTLAVRMSHTATTNVNSFKATQDGRAAYEALKEKCVGGPTGDTIITGCKITACFSCF